MIGWFINLSVQTFQPLIVTQEGLILCIIIEDVHQFIGHCLIPLDSWFGTHGIIILIYQPLLQSFTDIILKFTFLPTIRMEFQQKFFVLHNKCNFFSFKFKDMKIRRC